MSIHFALVGNQNCGKSTLFNYLTGSNQHVGNFPGVTVQKKEGALLRVPNASVIDLPGIYSLSPYTSEEIVTRDLLLYNKPDAIINVIDATNIERSLYLSLQLIELNIPMIIALNMMDELTASGGSIDIKAMSEALTIPVVPITANSGEGVAELVRQAVSLAENKRMPERLDFCSGPVHTAIHAIAHLIEHKVRSKGLPLRFSSTKLIEGDSIFAHELELSPNELDIIGHFTEEMENALGTDKEAALADMRYAYIENLCASTVHKPVHTDAQMRSVKIDYYLTHKYFALPIFVAIMGLIFWLTFDVIGSFLSSLLEEGIDAVTATADAALTALDISAPMHSLIIDGIFPGVGSVLSFLPTIITLFFFLSLLEDSGYMARVAFVMDKLLRKIGLSGRSFVPMLIGFGCTVPAVMSSRTLASERDRKMTIMLTPFISCSAKIPIYAVFTAAFFEKYQALVMIALYVGGMVMGILVALLFKHSAFRGKPMPFVMELPNYRLPSLKSVVLLMWDKAKDFLQRAFTVIFLATIIIWFLQSFDTRLNVVSDSADSLLALIGRVIAPVFAPLGFGDWRVSTSLITGFTAKEAVISTMSVLLGTSVTALGNSLGTLFTPVSAVSFLVFTLLYTPCVAAIAAIRREMGSKLQAFGVVVMQCVVAWIAAFVVFQIGSLIF